MATIHRRNGRYQVQIRKNQRPLVTKTFSRLADAKRWAGKTARDIENELFDLSPAPGFSSIGDLIDHYLLINQKESLSDSEIYRIRSIQKHIESVPIGKFKGSHLARYRDLRLKDIKGKRA